MRFVSDFLLQRQKGFGLEVAEGQILEFAANNAHSQPVRDGRVDIQRLARDALLLVRRQIFERAHVVQPVGQLHQHHANVVDHGQKHLADVFGLARFRSQSCSGG